MTTALPAPGTTQDGPLDGLRARCTAVAKGAAIGYLGLLGFTVAEPTALHGVVAVGLEMGMLATGGICALIAVVVWIFTQNADYVLHVWRLANAAKSTAAPSPTSRKPELLSLARNPLAPPADDPGWAAIPIARGLEARARRAGRHAG